MLYSLSLLPLCLLATAQLAPDTCDFAWPPGPGLPESFQAPNAELQSLLAAIDPVRIQAIITKLVSFTTRSTLSDKISNATFGIGGARDWIASEMRSYAANSGGRMTVQVQSFIQQPASEIPVATNISNIVATLKGSVEPNRAYLVSGHYDSRVSNVETFNTFSPGADDDASGVAVSMELARVFAGLNTSATMIFAAVAGEKQGLYGSTFLAQSLATSKVDIQGMFTNDIVGSPVADDGTQDPFSIRLFVQGTPTSESAATQSARAAIGGENDSPTRELGRFVATVAQNAFTQMNVRLIYRIDRFLRGGDHEPFLAQGFPAGRFTEPHENFAHQHQDVRVVNGVQFGDLIDFVDFNYTARAARVNAAAMYSLAMAPGTPKNAQLDTSVLTNNSTLTWTVDTADTGLVGYEILWRATDDPFWTNAVSVGKVGTATVLQSKDNVVFGVRAVGLNGLKSPAAFPFT